MRKTTILPIDEIPNLGERLIEFARNFPLATILDSNTPAAFAPENKYKKFDLIAGFAEYPLSHSLLTKFADLATITETNRNWYFGYLTYDVKNYIEDLSSSNPDWLGWPSILFYIPDILIICADNSITISSNHPKWNHQNIITKLKTCSLKNMNLPYLVLNQRMNKAEYLKRVSKIQEHIALGNIYEINFCLEFFDTAVIEPYERFRFMNVHSPSPFSAFLKYKNLFLLSASPERFLMKNKSKIISQPIKGTTSRGNKAEEDNRFKFELEKSIKERTENIMIVDLIRNDLSRISEKNSVLVEELCKIYSFPYVHQMISTIVAEITGLNFRQIIEATFPMGSMTGAPKISAMKIIEECENVKRGLYSGAVGYIAPGMDFDFNVVIRSLQYNASNEYLSYMAGSAITAASDPEKEYEECMLKAYAVNSRERIPVYAQ